MIRVSNERRVEPSLVPYPPPPAAAPQLKHGYGGDEGGDDGKKRNLEVTRCVAVVVVAQGDHVRRGSLPVGAAHAALQGLGKGLRGEGCTASDCQILTGSVVAGFEAHEGGLGEQIVALHSRHTTWVEGVAAVR